MGRLITDLGEKKLAFTKKRASLWSLLDTSLRGDVRRWPSLLATGDDALLGGLDTSITRVIVLPKMAANLIHNEMEPDLLGVLVRRTHLETPATRTSALQFLCC